MSSWPSSSTPVPPTTFRSLSCPPCSPKLNGRVERFNRTSREEFWQCYDGDFDLAELTSALRTPREYLAELTRGSLSHML